MDQVQFQKTYLNGKSLTLSNTTVNLQREKKPAQNNFKFEKIIML